MNFGDLGWLASSSPKRLASAVSQRVADRRGRSLSEASPTHPVNVPGRGGQAHARNAGEQKVGLKTTRGGAGTAALAQSPMSRKAQCCMTGVAPALENRNAQTWELLRPSGLSTIWVKGVFLWLVTSECHENGKSE